MKPSDRGLADMLRQFRGLESLAICISLRILNLESVQYLIDTINRNNETLKYILLQHDWGDIKHALFDAELYDVIKKCKNLSQLGLLFTRVKLLVFARWGLRILNRVRDFTD